MRAIKLQNASEIEKKHKDALGEYVLKKIEEVCGKKEFQDNYVDEYLKRIFKCHVSRCCCNRNANCSVLKSRIDELLVMSVDDMRKLVQDVNAINGGLPTCSCLKKKDEELNPREKAFKHVNKSLAKVFNWDHFSKSGKSKWCLCGLARELSKVVTICPYCNAETVYAYKVKRHDKDEFKFVKSSFDHYFPQIRYPFLALSLYNLIPSCTRCNSCFKIDDSDVVDMAHPYVDTEDMHKNMCFWGVLRDSGILSHPSESSILCVLLKERHGVSFPKGVKWGKMFYISESYSALYKKEVADAIWRATEYPKSYLDAKVRYLRSQGLPVGNIERCLYGAPLKDDEINLNRHSKMINDVVKQFRT